MIDYIILGCLFPIRVITFFSIHLMSFCLPTINNDTSPFIHYLFSTMNLLILLSVGLYPNKIIDQRKHDIQTKVITFQHRTFADAYIMNYLFGPIGYVFRARFKDNIFIKNFINKYGGVAVSAEPKQGSSKEIIEYCQNSSNKLAIAPEDIIDYKKRIISNNKLNVFRTGAFVPLLPIQPVVFKFYDESPIWRNYPLSAESTAHWFLRRFLSPITYFDCYLLEECSPKNNTTPQEYRDCVRDQMQESIKDF